jgi:anti-anti-sigma factor
MSAAAVELPTRGNNTDISSPTWEIGAARFTVTWGRSGGVITVRGELDAANADQFAGCMEQCAVCCDWLVLDLSELDFMGTAGLRALTRIDSGCGELEVRWALVPGGAVFRLLRICDPDPCLPVSESVTAALATVQEPRPLRPAGLTG